MYVSVNDDIRVCIYLFCIALTLNAYSSSTVDKTSLCKALSQTWPLQRVRYTYESNASVLVFMSSRVYSCVRI